MSVVLTLSNDQAKALNWLLGSVSASVNDDLKLSSIYNKLYDTFGYVGVDGAVRSEFGCWKRERSGKAVTLTPDSESVIALDVR